MQDVLTIKKMDTSNEKHIREKIPIPRMLDNLLYLVKRRSSSKKKKVLHL
jgi:hypothetical protein